MNVKSNPYRFTLSFNPDDPEQCEAAKIINSRNRDKCRLISAAVLFYVKERENCENTLLEIRVRQLVDQILIEKGYPFAVQNGEKSPSVIDAPTSAALLGGLDAFQ